MLRWTVLLVLLANLAFYAWTQGWLDTVVGSSPQGEREPQRLQRQLRPESVQLLSPRVAAVAAAAASASATGCLEAGPYTDAELAAAQDRLLAAGVAASRWQTPAVQRPGAWLLYMGRFPDRDSLLRKQTELQRIHVAFEPVHDNPELAPGLSLGRFDDRAAADAALAQLTQRGVRTARVVTLAPPLTLHLLRIERAEPALQTQLQAGGFHDCARGG